jgi:predicted secreted Zn-dependent protease
MGLGAKLWVVFAVVLLASAGAARADVSVKTKYYDIKGKTGLELFYDMNRKGPRHGFLTKAIAQTQFKTDIKGDLVHSNGVCRTRGAEMMMQITYVYPRPVDKLDSSLARRWKKFQASNIVHEEMHGRLAKKMVADVNRAMRGFKLADGQSCRKANAKLMKELDRIIVAYNKSQVDFDKREHRDGGPVEKSVLALVGKKK